MKYEKRHFIVEKIQIQIDVESSNTDADKGISVFTSPQISPSLAVGFDLVHPDSPLCTAKTTSSSYPAMSGGAIAFVVVAGTFFVGASAGLVVLKRKGRFSPVGAKPPKYSLMPPSK